jgi:hypothetical protein
MEKHIIRLVERKYDDSFSKTSAWLNESNNLLQKRKNQRRLIKMKEYILRHKIQFATIILLALLIAACNMPVTQNDTLGYVLSWTTPNSSSVSVSENLNKLTWYKNSDVTMNIKNVDGNEIAEYKLIVQALDDKIVMNYKNDLEKIKELTSIKIVPLNESVTRPVYSAALNSFFKIDINASKMNDEQVQAEIKRQLEEAGFNDMLVSYKKDESGKAKLEFKLKDGMKMEGNKNIEVNVDNNNGNQVVKMKTMKSDVDFSKMTDEEIRNHVREQNKDENLSDKDIKITRENGNVNVNVEKEVIK